MEMRINEKPIDPRFKIGMRNVKTALSVGVCILFFQFIGVGDGIQAAIAAIICMKSSLQNSIQTGVERVIGTFIGAVLGILALLLIEKMTFQISTILAITGVVLIIYLCNIFKVQASTVIGLVVFLIILIGEKDTPPIIYGSLRLIETFFGILVAYLINRFFDPRHIRVLIRDKTTEKPGVRLAVPGDLPQVMAVWLSSNQLSHPFIDGLRWHSIYDAVRKGFSDSNTLFVYGAEGHVEGFINLTSEMEIDALHVGVNQQGKGIEEELLEYCQEHFPRLSTIIYVKNSKLLETLLGANFYVAKEITDEETGLDQFEMAWSEKS